MKKIVYFLLSLLCLSLLVACGQSKEVTTTPFKNDITKTISSGEIKGKKDSTTATIEWLGIPYAAEPVGELRWKAPQPVEKWEGSFDATEIGSPFIQISKGEVVGSEGALNLDVVRPDNTEANLPVIVFLHGGNNQTGHAQEIKGNGFVNDINAVYVSINYRLGALGFNPLEALKTGTDEENSGNYTLLDIAAALDWVEENIEVFGGDKDNVTLAGFSAGGRDVMATLISPLFKDKYDKAISFSGGMTLADETDSQDIFATAIAPLVVEDGIKSTELEAKEWLLSNDRQVADYLYGLSAERLASLMGNAGIRMSVFPHLYKDGVVIPKEGFDTSNYNDVPLLLITGTSEFSLFTAFDPYFANSVTDGSLFSDADKLKEFVFAETYGSALYRLSNTVDSAREMQDSYKSPIYIGEISYGDNAETAPKTAQLLGAFHGVFEPLLQQPSNYAAFIGEDFETDGSKQLSQQFKAYLKEFIANGSPNGKDLPQWEEWTAGGNQVMKFDASLEKAEIELGEDSQTAEDIVANLRADSTLSADKKQVLIDNVLNGRWFSQPLDGLKVNE
ncbi:TPA: carboxylesterase/lipase family protein [Streptococcus suis]|uniref:carboxylesterase family protein n=1 Tax=Streptococcus suis TaxID=1307 RepID=UPI000CF3FF27|nr:carboxylesterase family protein [Streptococcus suis]MCK4045152.1 carboxylesterase family protein [Streptococcus suis]HEM2750063.1 carboxylesterase/lipase family protein [Streptococcus suis]HEM2753191.1 carboxylesterase/lipase family protein [Streptococcus suis]HEM5052632.1 carboxylesterase/lipase family protein [Streptococcus suis]HEM5161679.1 carboxylesterase/lipase family protein [Streptococcus suis]